MTFSAIFSGILVTGGLLSLAPAVSQETEKVQEIEKGGKAPELGAAAKPAPQPAPEALGTLPAQTLEEGRLEPRIPAPEALPPAPPSEKVPPPPATSTREQELPKGLPPGQWVFTGQYGWVWMPFADNYTHVPADGGTPIMYVYCSYLGWRWVVAPWLWGCGPMPYFGIYGPLRFAWWGRGFGHWYSFSGIYGHHGWGMGIHEHGRWTTYRPPQNVRPMGRSVMRPHGFRSGHGRPGRRH